MLVPVSDGNGIRREQMVLPHSLNNLKRLSYIGRIHRILLINHPEILLAVRHLSQDFGRKLMSRVAALRSHGKRNDSILIKYLPHRNHIIKSLWQLQLELVKQLPLNLCGSLQILVKRYNHIRIQKHGRIASAAPVKTNIRHRIAGHVRLDFCLQLIP